MKNKLRSAKDYRTSHKFSRILLFAKMTLFVFVLGLTQVKAGSSNSQNKSMATALQTQTVSGTVVDNTGFPLPGVNVMVKGTTTGTITDPNGKYSLEVSGDNAVLVFSFIGYAIQEKPVVASVIDVTLEEDTQDIDEVVVVGYGSQKKINLTGSVDAVGGEELADRPVSNLGEALQGVSPNLNISLSAAGGEPGAKGSWNIRGVGTLSGSGAPLVLVDGVQMDAENIDPETVESISVLKDASAAAIYGARAPFGVVLITTKKGSKSGKVKVTYKYNLGLASPINLPEFESSKLITTAFNQADVNAGAAPTFNLEQLQHVYGFMEGTYPHQYDPNGTYTNLWRGRWDGNANTEWYGEYFKKYSTRQTHSINLDGGSEKVQYHLGAGYYGQDGQYNWADEYFKRYNMIANISSAVTDWLKLDFSTKYSQTQTKLPLGEGGRADRNEFYHEIGIFWPTTPHVEGAFENPFVQLLKDGGHSKKIVNDLWTTIGAEFEPIKDWKTKMTYNFNNYETNGYSHFKEVYVNVPDASNQNIGAPTNAISKYYNNGFNTMANVYTSYEKTLGVNYFKLMVGYERLYKEYGGLSGSRNGLITNEVPSISTAVGDAIVLDDFLEHSSTQGFFGRLNYMYDEKILFEASARYDGSSRFAPDHRWGMFPSASVGYVVSKEDFWSPISGYVNNFKVRGSYGSLGNQNVSNYLYLSNMNIRTQTPPNSPNVVFNGNLPLYVGNAPGLISPTLTWETVTTADIGFDAGFFDNKLTATFDWYNRTTSDMFGPGDITTSVLGTGSPMKNNAVMSTKGWEISLNWKHQVSDVKYSVGIALADSKSKVLEYKNEDKLLTDWYEGKEMGEIWGYETDRLIQNNDDIANMPDQSKFYATWTPGDMLYKDKNGDGIINDGANTLDDHGDLVKLGNSTPRYTVGINATASWKGLDFRMFWQGVLKRDFYVDYSPYSGNMFYGMVGSNTTSTLLKGTDHLDYWRPANEVEGFENITLPDGSAGKIYHLGANTDSFFPKPYTSSETAKNLQKQSKYLINAAYMRLKNIQLGYTLPQDLTRKAHIEKLRFYISGENLLTFTKVPKMADPEALIDRNSFTGNNGYHGVGKMYPLSRIYSFGVNLTF
jgi:TonB-linked SusC/RagA family outer membrane protein